MKKMSYIIKTVNDKKDVEKGNRADINICNWGGEYRPVSYAKLVFVKDEGFMLKITSEESDPRATYTEQNSSVCKDSCLEFFANFKPGLPDTGYLNFEGNANGSLLACYGKNIEERETLLEMGINHPVAVPFKDDGKWGYEMFLPLSVIKAVYGNADYNKGDIIKGSFYKCGDDTKIPHYLSYNKINWEYPAFHRPECFVDMIID